MAYGAKYTVLDLRRSEPVDWVNAGTPPSVALPCDTLAPILSAANASTVT
jgi:hypothetical protein